MKQLPDSFWLRVRKTPGCWLWTGDTNKDGYGRLQVGGKKVYAHRYAYGDPRGVYVLHRCDNPPCVRRSHLFAGTQAINMRDRNAKGRQAKGERNGRAKLNAEQVAEIRNAYAPHRMTRPALAERYGVSEAVIGDILARRTWKHVEVFA